MDKRFFLTFLLVAFLMAAFGGCDPQPSDLPRVDMDDIARARAVWEQRRSANYDMVVRYRHGGMLPSASPVVIEVRDGKAVNIRPIVGDDRPIHFYSSLDTVEKIFERMKEATIEGVEVRSLFNLEHGYPTKVAGQFSKSNTHQYDLSIDELVQR